MNQLKKFKTAALVLLPILILIIIRMNNPGIFQEPISKAMEGTKDRGNLITPNQLKKLGASSLVIDLSNKDHHDSLQFHPTISISPERLLDPENREILDRTKGTVVLYADDVAISSKAWIILNQLGYSNLYILTLEEDPEVLKYKFQPDTSARLEEELN
jgi:hypothetical protein